jgi:hypothetical protein
MGKKNYRKFFGKLEMSPIYEKKILGKKLIYSNISENVKKKFWNFFWKLGIMY